MSTAKGIISVILVIPYILLLGSMTFRFIENLSWNKVADRIGGGNSEDGVRMSFERFMKK